MSKKFKKIDFVKSEMVKEYMDEDVNTYDFPLDVFPDDVKEMITIANRTLNFSIDYLAASYLSLIGSLNGNKIKLKVKATWSAPSIFWLAIVGDTGAAKSHPIDFIFKPLKNIEKARYKEYESGLTQYEVELEAWEGQKPGLRGTRPVKPTFKQMEITDATLESIYIACKLNPNGLYLYKDEMMGWINSMNQYRKVGGDMEFWLETFNNNEATVNRVTRGISKIFDININIIGGIQPVKLREIKLGENGFIERMLFTRADDTVQRMSKEKMPDEVMDWHDSHVRSIFEYFEQIEETIQISISEKLFDLYIELDGDIVDKMQSEDIDKGYKGYLSKMRTYYPRFILVMYILDLFDGKPYSTEVTESQLRRAKKVIDYFATNAYAIFQENSKLDDMDSVTMKPMKKEDKVIELINQGFKGKDIAKKLNISAARVSQIKSKIEQENKNV